MRLSIAALLLLAGNGLASYSHELALLEASKRAPAGRSVQAANLVSDLTRRDGSIKIRNEFDMHYYEENCASGKQPMSAEVRAGSYIPTLLLEELEGLLEEVHCSDGLIEVYTTSTSTHHDLKRAIESYPDIRLVTSHSGCNDKGARVPYSVMKSTFSEDKTSITFEVVPLTWDAFDLGFSFGPAQSAYKVNSHDHLVRRQSPSQSFSVVSNTAPSSASSTSAIPTIAAISVELAAQANASIINEVILPKSEFGNDDSTVPSGLSVTCKNCSIGGELELGSGAFLLSNGTSNFLTNGYVGVNLTELFAHVELEVEWKPGGNGITIPYNIHLPAIPLSPFEIPGIGVVGPSIITTIRIGVTLDAALEFGFGFEVDVPVSSATLHVVNGIAQPNISTVDGFESAQFHSLPFSAGIVDASFTVFAAFEPEIFVGIQLFNGAFSPIGAGIVLTLPQVSVEIQEVPQPSDENCNPVQKPTSLSGVLDALGNLTDVVVSVEIAAGIFADIGENTLSTGASYVPFVTTFGAPSSCLAEVSSTLVPVTEAIASAEASSSASAAISSAASAAISSAASAAGSILSAIASSTNAAGSASTASAGSAASGSGTHATSTSTSQATHNAGLTRSVGNPFSMDNFLKLQATIVLLSMLTGIAFVL